MGLFFACKKSVPAGHPDSRKRCLGQYPEEDGVQFVHRYARHSEDLTPEEQQQEEVRQPRVQSKSQPPAQRHVEGNVRGSGSERRTGLVRMRPACLDPATRLQFP